MDSNDILQRSIDSLDKLIESLHGISDEAKQETTYSIGDRFWGGDEKWLMTYQCNENVALSGMANGILHLGQRRVENADRITQDEFNKICAGTVFTRYWDSQRGVGTTD